MLIAFDFDGVIADSLPEIFDATVAVARKLGTPRLPSMEDFRSARELTFSSVGSMLGLTEEGGREFAKEIFLVLEGSEMPFAIYPGMGPILERMCRSHRVVIITSNIEKRVRKTLEVFAPGAASVDVFDGRYPGTKADKIRLASERYTAIARRTFMVGDSFSDITAGKEAGARTIAVTWGVQPHSILFEARPEFIVDDPAGLQVILDDEASRSISV